MDLHIGMNPTIKAFIAVIFGGVGSLYGMSANIPIKGVMDAFLKRYMDLVYKL